MPSVSRNGSQESNPGQSGSKACVLPVPAPDTSRQVGQILVEVRRQAIEPQWCLCEGKSLTGEGGRVRKVCQFPRLPRPLSPFSSGVCIPSVRTWGFLSPCLWSPLVTGWRLQVWELFWSKYRNDWCSTKSQQASS